MLTKKLLFIGGGNMAEGIIRGQINNKAIAPADIFVHEVLPARAAYLQETYGLQLANDLPKALNSAEIVFIAVRPQDAAGVLESIRAAQNSTALVVSICAGVTLDAMQEKLCPQQRIARVMPNVLIEARQGYSGVCINGQVSADDKKDLETMLDAIGQTLFIKESLFDEFTAFSCAGPAYILHFMTAMIDAGVHSGFARADSAKMVIANMIGAAKMVEMTGKHPYQITDTMTSPAGVTIEGLKVLGGSGLHGIVMDCVEQAVKRAHSLS